MKLFLTILMLWASNLRAFGAAGAASSPYLKMPLGVRGTAMGEAFTGIANDVQGIYYNPAGLTQLSAGHLMLMHNESFGGVRYENFSLALPAEMMGMDMWGTIGFAYTLVAIEDIPRTRILPGTSDVYDQAYADRGFLFTSGASTVDLSYAWQATKTYSIGGTLKFINEKVDTVDGWGVATDLGILTKADFIPGFTAGLTLLNIGTSPTHAPLPISMRLGLGHHWLHPFTGDEDADKITTGFDFIMPVVPVDGVPHFNFGTEYHRWINRQFFALRVGYRVPTDLDALAGLTAGGGYGFQAGGNDISLDYAFVPYGVLGMSHRVALNVVMGTKPRIMRASGTGLLPPTGLMAKPGDRRVGLSWQPPPVKVDGYNIYMSYYPEKGTWYKLNRSPVATIAQNLGGFQNGYRIFMAVTSVRKRGDGTWEESAKSVHVPATPAGVRMPPSLPPTASKPVGALPEPPKLAPATPPKAKAKSKAPTKAKPTPPPPPSLPGLPGPPPLP